MISRGDSYRFAHEQAAAKIKEESGGRLDVKWFYGGELIPTSEQFEAVQTGTIELSFDMTGYHTGFMPEAAILFMLPGSMQSPEDSYHMALAPEWMMVDKIVEAYAEQGVQVFAHGMTPSNYLLMSSRPFSRLADLDDFKIRSYGTLSEWLGQTGASMVYIPGQEIYTSMAMGIVDATTWDSYGMNWNYKFQEVTNYIWEIPGARANWEGVYLANPDAWAELPDDLKLMLKYYHTEASTWLRWWTILEDKIRKEQMLAEPYNIQIVEMPQEDLDLMVQYGQDLWKELAGRSPLAKEWIQYIEEWMKWRGYLAEDAPSRTE